jgi:hypothetical protein
MTKISGLVKGAKTTEFGVLWLLAVWLGVDRFRVNSENVLRVVVEN